MVNISKKKIDEDLLKKFYQIFIEVLKRGGRKKEFHLIMNDFFTSKERILFAKRMMIIYLLSRKDIEKINIIKLLKISSETISKYSFYLEERSIPLINLIKQVIAEKDFMDFISNLLADFLIQPGIRIGHWKRYWNHKRKVNLKKTYGI